MPWCPKCRNEYREGFTVCADCGVDLVDELTEEEVKKIALLKAPLASVMEIMDFLDTTGLKGYSHVENEDGTAFLMVEEENQKQITFAIQAYMKKRKEAVEEYNERMRAKMQESLFGEDEDGDEEDDSSYSGKESDDEDDEDYDEDDEEEKVEEKVFRSSKEKADDAKSSAISLLVVGLIGLIFEALVVFHVLPLKINGVPGIVLYAFLACVFLILIISGIASFFTAKRLKNAIVDETEIKNEILDFCKHEAVETANKMLGKGGGNDLYFARVDFLKSAIKREPKFKNVDDVTIDGLLDENYSELFPDED
ncbi:MAG: hypothetical protein IKN45_04220 [Lachnospiraceae bacterium]|nr:hypothetical protein [Lachnospiraceae bacterium]